MGEDASATGKASSIELRPETNRLISCGGSVAVLIISLDGDLEMMQRALDDICCEGSGLLL